MNTLPSDEEWAAAGEVFTAACAARTRGDLAEAARLYGLTAHFDCWAEECLAEIKNCGGPRGHRA